MCYERQAAALHLKLSPPLSPSEKFVLIALADAVNTKTHACFPSVQTIAFLTGFNERTVKRAIKVLSTRGVIAVAERFRTLNNGKVRKTTNSYSFPFFSKPDAKSKSSARSQVYGSACQSEKDRMAPLLTQNSELRTESIIEMPDQSLPEERRSRTGDRGGSLLQSIALVELKRRECVVQYVRLDQTDRKSLSEFLRFAGENSLEILSYCFENWDEYTSHAKRVANAFDCPTTPMPRFIGRYAHAAADFWATKRNEVREIEERKKAAARELESRREKEREEAVQREKEVEELRSSQEWKDAAVRLAQLESYLVLDSPPQETTTPMGAPILNWKKHVDSEIRHAKDEMRRLESQVYWRSLQKARA